MADSGSGITLKQTEEDVSPFLRVLFREYISPRPFLFEDEECVVLSSDNPARYYFKVVPRKPVTMLPKPNMEESDVSLKEHLVYVTKQLAYKYGLADDIGMAECNGYPGARFSFHFNLHVFSKNMPIDPASVSFMPHKNNVEGTGETEQLELKLKEYEEMDEKYRKFVAFEKEDYDPSEDWRDPEDSEMRELKQMEILQRMFPYTIIEDKPFSFFLAHLPNYIPLVKRFEEHFYQTSESPMAYFRNIETWIDEVKMMFRKNYNFPKFMTPEDE